MLTDNLQPLHEPEASFLRAEAALHACEKANARKAGDRRNVRALKRVSPARDRRRESRTESWGQTVGKLGESWGQTERSRAEARVTGQNNGKISSQYNAISGETVQYVYDSLNRLGSAAGSGWGNSYVYDGFGNLLQKNVTAGSAPTLTQTVNAANNQINGRSYDANGNDITGSFVSYDFLNRMISYGGTYLNEYSYDAANRRIYKAAYSNGSTLQSEGYILYGLDGENLGTYTPTLFNNGSGQEGMLLEQATGRTYFFGKKLFTTEDMVGSAASQGTFFPWGEQRTGNTSEQYGFATYWQDSESGLDFFGARYFSGAQGRFTTPDWSARPQPVPYAKFTDPQTLNLYSYVRNNPLSLRDLDGHKLDCSGDNAKGIGCQFLATWNTMHGIKTPSVTSKLSFPSSQQPQAADPQKADVEIGKPEVFTKNATLWNTSATTVNGLAVATGGLMALPLVPEAAAGASAAANWTANATGLLGSATGRVFWSAVGSGTAAEWAEQNGGSTLEMSPLGSLANWAQGYLPQTSTTGAAWSWLSGAFASGAQGPVTYLQGPYVGNTWQYVEKPILEMQGNPITVNAG